MVFIRMDNVETLKEQFDGDVYFRARWREPKLDNLKVQRERFFFLLLSGGGVLKHWIADLDLILTNLHVFQGQPTSGPQKFLEPCDTNQKQGVREILQNLVRGLDD